MSKKLIVKRFLGLIESDVEVYLLEKGWEFYGIDNIKELPFLDFKLTLFN